VKFREILQLVRATVLAAGLFLLGGLVPVLGVPVMLCAPAPILIYGLARDRLALRISLALVLTLALIASTAGPLQGLGFALSLGLATMLIAVTIRRRWPAELIVLAGGSAVLAAVVAAFLIWAGSPAALLRALHDSVAASLSHSAALYKKMGMNDAEAKEIGARTLDLTTRLAPALGAMLAALTLLLNLGLIWRWLGEEKIGYPLFTGLPTWRTPEWLIWLLLATGFGMFIPLPGAWTAGLNGFVLVAAVYFCQGLAIMSYYLQKLAMPRVVRVTVYLMTLLWPILAVLVCLAGIFDMWIDFRRLKPPSQEAGSIDDFF
jgi:uncharacterized protein YybS (DUF2232 family)